MAPVPASQLQLVLVTDGRGDLGRLDGVVRAAIAGGVRCVQLRERQWTARELLQAALRLAPLLDAVGGWLLVNDRVDVAACGAAHGAQVGHRSLPPELARRVLGNRLQLGYSAHDAVELDHAADAGCDFALLSPVWPTTSKPGQGSLGERRAMLLTQRARLPVVWLGGITVELARRVAGLPPTGRPVGIAVRSAIMDADDPAAGSRALLAAFRGDS